MKKLKPFWSHSGLLLNWKRRIYTTVFIPMVTYGLETSVLTRAMLQKLETFHHRSLRRIAKIPAAFISRVSRAEVRRITNMPTLTSFIQKQGLKLLTEVMTAPQNNIMRSVSFHPAGALRAATDIRRAGKPRQEWTSTYGQLAFQKIFPNRNLPGNMPSVFQILHEEVKNKRSWETNLQIGTPTQRQRSPRRVMQRGPNFVSSHFFNTVSLH